MKLKHYITTLMLLSFLITAACGSSGPQKAINGLSKALETKDTELLKLHVDIPRLARSMAESAQAEQEKAWNQTGSLFGAESNPFSGFFPRMTDPKIVNSIIENFPLSVANGQLVYTSKEKGWPWDPDALKKTTIEETGTNSAVAMVDAPTGLRTFLSLRKDETGVWKITGFYDKKAPAAYWCSDQRISDIKAENAKRIASAEKKNSERLAQWEKRKAEYDRKKEIYDKWTAQCAAEEENLKAQLVESLDKIEITISSKKMSKAQRYAFTGPEDALIVKIQIQNNNELPATIKSLSLATSETASGTIFKKRESSLRDVLTIPPGKAYQKEMTFFVNRGPLKQDEAKQILNGDYTLIFSAETIVLGEKTLDRSRGIDRRDKSSTCNAYISKPFSPGPKPTPLKPKLLDV